jgi:hypothetical protein
VPDILFKEKNLASDDQDKFSASIGPINFKSYEKFTDTKANGDPLTEIQIWNGLHDDYAFNAMISEGVGAFIVVLMTMMIATKT